MQQTARRRGWSRTLTVMASPSSTSFADDGVLCYVGGVLCCTTLVQQEFPRWYRAHRLLSFLQFGAAWHCTSVLRAPLTHYETTHRGRDRLLEATAVTPGERGPTAAEYRRGK